MNTTRTRLTEDPYLEPYLPVLNRRAAKTAHLKRRLGDDLRVFANAHEYYGMHFRGNKWIFREWAPNATQIYLTGECNGWEATSEYGLRKVNKKGDWELVIPGDRFWHGMLYKLYICWDGGSGDRIPAYARRVVQDPETLIFNAQIWLPETPYRWKHPHPAAPPAPCIYEAHVGMAQQEPRIGTYAEFRDNTLPRIRDAGYTTVQLMAVQEHPYYGSFGYQVSSFFAASSRFGTPEELKSLVDTAHGMGLRVIMDIVHSHAVANEVEGLSKFDGTEYQYFHGGDRGFHPAWSSRLFDYGKIEVIHFLLSNLKYWLDEYHVDGFRFDGITSMLYTHHGLGTGFSSYDDYFNETVDEDAVSYLTLANELLHRLHESAISIAEDVSGMPGLAAPADEMGCGFDYRMAMGVTDYWFKLCKEVRDEDWNMYGLWNALTDRRSDEQTVSYVECHDQALVGGKSLIFEMADSAMYSDMHESSQNLVIDRALALHKMTKLLTFATCGQAYLNFMGNEFGHPEWIDFPREGNGWSYQYCRRQWNLRDNPQLHYSRLAAFDKAMCGLLASHDFIAPYLPEALHLHDADNVIAVQRGEYIFVCNFHPVNSYTDYGISLDDTVPYRHVLDTDQKEFSGYARVHPNQRYIPHIYIDESGHRSYQIKLYIPSRCAIVLHRETGERVKTV